MRSRIGFTEPMHGDDPVGALLDIGVGILAGCCEVVAQINTTIRSNPLLAAAWGRERFTEQSTIARMLDACRFALVSQMRAASEGLLCWKGRYQHDFRHAWLRLDNIDLTALLVLQRRISEVE